MRLPQAVLVQRIRATQLGRRAESCRMDPRFIEWVSAQCDFCGDDDGGSGAWGWMPLHGGLVSAWCWRARSGQDARDPRQAAGRSPSRLARSATPIRQRRTSATVRSSVGAPNYRSGYGESTVRWKRSPGSNSERIVAIPPAHPRSTPAILRSSSSSGLTRGSRHVITASSSRATRPTDSAGATRGVLANGSPLFQASVRPVRLLRG